MYERIWQDRMAPRPRPCGCDVLLQLAGGACGPPACGNSTARMPQAANFSMVDPENLGLE
jgi:hypothetical protein